MTYREFTIKKKNGKHRRICAPDADLLAAQRSILPVLSTLFSSTELQLFGHTKVFHGFIKDRNCVTAAIQHIGYAHTIGLDISNCFDTIQLDDINVPLENPERFSHTDGTLAQGFATSPMLANIYLLTPVKEICDILDIYYTDYKLTVYADDIQLSFPPSSYTKLNDAIAIVTEVMSDYGLTINPAKTRIHHAKFGNRRILGVMVGPTGISPTRKIQKKIRCARHQRNGPSLGGLVTSSRLLLPRALR